MSYRWIDGLTRADLAMEATGADLVEVFRSAWEATVAVMLDDGELPVGPEARELALAAPSWEDLLLALLERVVFVKDAEGILLGPLTLTLGGCDGAVSLEARASSTPVEAVLDRLGTDVKAVTLHRFSLARVGDGWRATVVLDV